MSSLSGQHSDVLVVGAGPVGLACAIECQRHSLSVRVVEKGGLVNSLLGYPTNMEFFSTPDLLEIGEHPFPTLGYKPIREEAIDYYRRVAFAEGLQLSLYNRVGRVDGNADTFEVHTQKGVFTSSFVIVATGFFDLPRLMNIEGEDLPKVTHYYKEPFAYAGQDVAVIGAKNSAAKAALECYRHGARVTLVARGPAISNSVKYWIKPDLENRIAEGAIRAYFNTTVIRITPTEVVLATPSGTESIPNDWVLALTGYSPDYEFLSACGIEMLADDHRTPRHDERTFETNRAGVYLAGTVCGGLNTSRWFIENGREHAKTIADHISVRMNSKTGAHSTAPFGPGSARSA